MADPETITLPKSGVVLRRLNTRCEMYGPINLMPVLCHVKALAAGTGFQSCFTSHWHDGTRDECLAWIDARVLELRAALLPPGAIVVRDSPETRERIARSLWDGEGYSEPWGEAAKNSHPVTYRCVLRDTDAVLAALRESRL